MATVARLTDIFRAVFDEPELILRPEMTANDVDGWDSLTHMNLILAVEKTFGIRFESRELMRQRNVGDMLGDIERKLPACKLPAS